MPTKPLRYRIFAQEQGATLENAEQGLDCDYYDDYCHHLQPACHCSVKQVT